MMLKKCLKPDSIALKLKATDKTGAIRELVELLARAGLLEDKEIALKDILARESRMSTGMEMGLAIPHARTRATENLTVAAGLAPNGIDFGSLDGKPARAIFLVLSGPESSGPHIECIAEIANAYSNPEVREQLLKASSAEEFIRVLSP